MLLTRNDKQSEDPISMGQTMHYRVILSINHIISLIPYAHGAIKPCIAISRSRPEDPWNETLSGAGGSALARTQHPRHRHQRSSLYQYVTTH